MCARGEGARVCALGNGDEDAVLLAANQQVQDGFDLPSRAVFFVCFVFEISILVYNLYTSIFIPISAY